VALTVAAWLKCVGALSIVPRQDKAGQLRDALTMLRCGIRGQTHGVREARFGAHVECNHRDRMPPLVRRKARFGLIWVRPKPALDWADNARSNL
jgi:hypothetical protein